MTFNTCNIALAILYKLRLESSLLLVAFTLHVSYALATPLLQCYYVLTLLDIEVLYIYIDYIVLQALYCSCRKYSYILLG